MVSRNQNCRTVKRSGLHELLKSLDAHSGQSWQGDNPATVSIRDKDMTPKIRDLMRQGDVKGITALLKTLEFDLIDGGHREAVCRVSLIYAS